MSTETKSAFNQQIRCDKNLSVEKSRKHGTTTSLTVPVIRISTLILVGSPLEFLLYHRNDRFPRSITNRKTTWRGSYPGQPGEKGFRKRGLSQHS